MTKIKRLMGIDPGVKNSGIAAWHPETRSWTTMTTLPWDLARQFIEALDPEEYGIIIEDPDLDSNLFGGWDVMSIGIDSYRHGRITREMLKIQYRTNTRIARDVGKNQMVAQVLRASMEYRKIPHLRIAPSNRDSINDRRITKKIQLLQYRIPTKTTAEQFETITGYSGRSSSHSRDAATLVYDRTVQWFCTQLKLNPKTAVTFN